MFILLLVSLNLKNSPTFSYYIIVNIGTNRLQYVSLVWFIILLPFCTEFNYVIQIYLKLYFLMCMYTTICGWNLILDPIK